MKGWRMCFVFACASLALIVCDTAFNLVLYKKSSRSKQAKQMHASALASILNADAFFVKMHSQLLQAAQAHTSNEYTVALLIFERFKRKTDLELATYAEIVDFYAKKNFYAYQSFYAYRNFKGAYEREAQRYFNGKDFIKEEQLQLLECQTAVEFYTIGMQKAFANLVHAHSKAIYHISKKQDFLERTALASNFLLFLTSFCFVAFWLAFVENRSINFNQNNRSHPLH